MAHETVPADIAAAIDRVERAHLGKQIAWERFGKDFDPKDPFRPSPEAIARVDRAEGAYGAARAALNAVILHHLRGYAEMKAALERIEQGA